MKLNAFKPGMPKWLPPKLLLIMKMVIIIMTATFLQVSASSFGQKVTLTESNISLDKLFKQIRKQTGYDFIFDTRIMKSSKPIDVKFLNEDLSSVLNKCLSGQHMTFEINEHSIVIKEKEHSFLDQLIEKLNVMDVKGKIVDEKGRPVPGASIKIKKSNSRGTISASDGSFRITGTDGDVLIISYVGYKTQEIKLKPNQSLLTVTLELEVKSMNEVTIVNTGLFKKADKSFTGASTTVTAKELKQFGSRDLITSLRNIDPSFNIIESNTFGSNPNRMPEIQIRGNSSIPNVNDLQNESRVGLNTPLIILDGFTSSLQKMLDMNPEEVESITLLKDAAATALYGSRGANGVVVIITKPPVPGKLRLTFNSRVAIEAPDLSDYHLLNAKDKLDLEWKAGYYDSKFTQGSDVLLKRYYNFLLNEVNRDVETDWLAIPLRNGVGQRHNLRIEGGDNALRYAASAQVNNIEGVMKGSSRNTFNGAITLSYVYKNIRFRNNLQIQQGKSNESKYGSFADYSKMNPYWRPFDENGKVLKQLGHPGNYDFGEYWGVLETSPLYNAGLNTFDKSEISELTNNSSIEWNVLKELVIRGQFGITKTTMQTDKFRPADHTAFANYAPEDIFRKGDYNYGIANGLGYDGALNLSYSNTFAEKHQLFGGMDLNARQAKNSSYNFVAEGFQNENFDFITMGLQYKKDGKPTGTEGITRAVGFTGNLNYSYDDRYFADGVFRLDGASQFGSNKRFAPFWSAGLGWNIHNEAFFKDNKYVNRLKLRGSAGITGSQNFSAYQAQSTYQYYTDQRYYNWIGANLIGLGNENLQWQQAMKYNIGIDAEFLSRRLKIVADFYRETTKDLVSSVNLPASNGFSSYVDNIGRLENRGYELKATGFLLANPEKVVWSVSASLMRNKNKVLETSQALKDAQKAIQNGTTTPGVLYVEGYSSKTIWVVPSLGIDPGTGKELYMGRDGLATYVWNGADIKPVGSAEPKMFGNFSTMVRYKDFAINASFRYNSGGQQYNETLVNRVETGNYKYNVDSRVYYSRWQQPGDIAAFKGLLVTGATSKTSRFVQDENTIVCQNVNLQYDLRSKPLLRKLGMQALNLTADVSEPLYLSTIRRERGTAYPFSLQFSFSINATF
ncbi:SusC/RagA family TonB-linked outer membrane protein [Pedobacter hiemivivus]|uniref:SusC/RagA family TonB-linked outer membrane protein n=1 Tax=Pedobacter hiemivivus TaxID=2530454 RepID=A0A4R0NK09_9SPHI|nr:SusC/RagA family TonB-linked outer membrane protein [Pedobacter hiemivivus]TCC99653.1 SusC/RagA family TonB-linked outer membrane protein [Pedobacter hiemivivus]